MYMFILGWLSFVLMTINSLTAILDRKLEWKDRLLDFTVYSIIAGYIFKTLI